MSDEEFRQHLLRTGKVSQLPAADRKDGAAANGAVNGIPDVAAHPQLAARGRWVEVDSPAGRIPALLPPHNLLHAAAAMGAVPSLGQHTDEILKELG
jgi:itaconate CoA-transferase